MNITVIKDIILASVGIITAFSLIVGIIFQVRNYKIIQSKENENELYKLKLDKYSILVRESYLLLEDMRENIRICYLKFKENKLTEEIGVEIANKLDDRMDEFQNFYYINSTFLPKNINDLFDSLLDKMYEELETNNEDQNEFDIAFKHLNEYVNLLDNIVNDMREDIGVTELNTKMKVRIKG